MKKSVKINKLDSHKITRKNIEDNLKYLKLLAKDFSTISKASTEVINLQAILNLPKGTEHFISDIHGEYESFIHVLKNASGVIKMKIEDIFKDSLSEAEKKSLATLIYYPAEKINIIKMQKSKGSAANNSIKKWYEKTLYQLIEIARVVSSKYTRSKVRKSFPIRFSYILEELLYENPYRLNKQDYYEQIIATIIDLDRARDFIIALSNLIQRLSVDKMHILGDIFDRGPGADIIIDALVKHHSVDFQWGNHDILWMGAASGSRVCVATVLRLSLRYGNMGTLEEGYGINILPLATFAMEFYKDENNVFFDPKNINNDEQHDHEISLIRKMHKAIAIIQFKLEGQFVKRRPEFEMESRLVLEKINKKDATIILDDKVYKLNDNYFPTLDLKEPYKLTMQEERVIEKLTQSFQVSSRLQKHINFLYSKGSLYLKYNSNLMFHGCVPMNEDGKLSKFKINGKSYSGKLLYDKLYGLARDAFFRKEIDEKKLYDIDIMYYLWCGPKSPLFGKDKMATFERYFINDKDAQLEIKNSFFTMYRDKVESCKLILKNFKMDVKNSKIICGHVPVKVNKGESPIKAKGMLLVIDGGFSKAYQPQTGIAGYTLIYNSFGMQLASHESFDSTKKAIDEEKDILSTKRILDRKTKRIRIKDTDIGTELKNQIAELKMLLTAFKMGLIKENLFRYDRRGI